MTTSIPDQLRLDNAANIYPASMSKHYASLYRMKVTLTQEVDHEMLQKALELTSERIPTFRYRLKSGGFWWYLQRVEATPELTPLKPLKNFNFKEQKRLLYRVSAVGNQIFLDVFHALTDGYGAMSFLLTLTGEYLHRKYGLSIRYDTLTLDPRDPPSYAEVEDSFKTVFSGRHGTLERNVDAYHIRGAALPFLQVKDLRAVMPMDKLREVCRSHDCSVTDLLTSAMLRALYAEYRKDRAPGKRSVLKVSVPVNLRPVYGSRTVRNFSSYVNIGIDVKDGCPDFGEIVREVKAQKAYGLRKENLEPKIAANVELEEMLLVRCLPLVVKHPVIDIINLLHGDRFCSQTLSNMGQVEVPDAMAPYIRDLDFILGRQRGNSGAASCLGYRGKLYFHLTRKIARDGFEKAFLGQLERLGIPFASDTESLA